MFDFLRKLLLTKEIVSKTGIVHFRRYRLLETPWLRIYVHQILQSDQEKHPHNHPWNFSSLILSGKYEENVVKESKMKHWFFKIQDLQSHLYGPLQFNHHKASDYHKLTLLTPSVWSLFFAYGKGRPWGYLLNDNSHADHQTYRKLKNMGKL